MSNVAHLVAEKDGKCSYMFGQNELEAKGGTLSFIVLEARKSRALHQRIQHRVGIFLLALRQHLSRVLAWRSGRPLIRALTLPMRAASSQPQHLLTPSLWSLGFLL